MNDQVVIASQIIHLLVKSKQFDSVKLCGSVAKGQHDRLSDIDVLVACSNRSPKDNVELASVIVEAEYGVMIRDWSLSLLPEKYLISHFLPQAPIFWWLDIGCMPDASFKPLSRSDIGSDINLHIATLWVMNAKHMLRNTQNRLRIKELYAKVFGAEAVFPSEVNAFKQILESIDFTEVDKDFQAGCIQIMLVIEEMCQSTHKYSTA